MSTVNRVPCGRKHEVLNDDIGYCMQDVCISFWKEDGSQDMMLKVTDICSTDPNDPSHCASPVDIKIDRTKASIMEGAALDSPAITGNAYPDKVWWFFTKCWDDVSSLTVLILIATRAANNGIGPCTTCI